MKRYVSLVCDEFVTRDYTVLYLVSKLAQAGPHQNARQNLWHGQVIWPGPCRPCHLWPDICTENCLTKEFSLPGTEWGIEQGPCGIIKTFDMLCTQQRKSFCNSMLESLYSFFIIIYIKNRLTFVWPRKMDGTCKLFCGPSIVFCSSTKYNSYWYHYFVECSFCSSTWSDQFINFYILAS